MDRSHQERLRRLAEAGDRDAAAQLARDASRRGDAALAVTAHTSTLESAPEWLVLDDRFAALYDADPEIRAVAMEEVVILDGIGDDARRMALDLAQRDPSPGVQIAALRVIARPSTVYFLGAEVLERCARALASPGRVGDEALAALISLAPTRWVGGWSLSSPLDDAMGASDAFDAVCAEAMARLDVKLIRELDAFFETRHAFTPTQPLLETLIPEAQRAALALSIISWLSRIYGTQQRNAALASLTRHAPFAALALALRRQMYVRDTDWSTLTALDPTDAALLEHIEDAFGDGDSDRAAGSARVLSSLAAHHGTRQEGRALLRPLVERCWSRVRSPVVRATLLEAYVHVAEDSATVTSRLEAAASSRVLSLRRRALSLIIDRGAFDFGPYVDRQFDFFYEIARRCDRIDRDARLALAMQGLHDEDPGVRCRGLAALMTLERDGVDRDLVLRTIQFASSREDDPRPRLLARLLLRIL